MLRIVGPRDIEQRAGGIVGARNSKSSDPAPEPSVVMVYGVVPFMFRLVDNLDATTLDIRSGCFTVTVM